MDNMLVWIGVAALVVIVLAFNFLVGRKNQVETAFSSIDVQLKKRYELIPNLVAVCEKYMGYEQKVLADLTATRTRILAADDETRVALDGALSSQLKSVFAVAENYPELAAAETFTMLQRSLNEVEEQLAAARRFFNSAVNDYNNAVEMFPTNVLARLLGYRRRTWFEAAADEREAVKVWR